jgi:hypothetical protein
MPFPKKDASSTKYNISADKADLPTLLRERQSVLAHRNQGLPNIVVRRPQVARGRFDRFFDFSVPSQKLANAQISCCNPLHNRI